MLQNLIVFGGKGGVGKSSVSTATAVKLADLLPEKKILLISFDIAHNLSDLFKKEVGNNITQITENLWAIEPDPHEYAEAYTKEFSTKARKLIKSFPIVGAIPDLQKFIDTTFTADSIPLALKNSIFFQSIIDADNPIENLETEGEEKTPFDIIVADFPPTGNMISLFEIPENHIQQLLKYSLEMIAQVRKFTKQLRKVTRVMNPLSWVKKTPHDEEKKELAEELLQMLKALEHRGKRISQLMKSIGSLRIVTIAEKPSVEESIRARELSLPYIHVEGIHVNRIMPEEPAAHCEFCDHQRINQLKYLEQIEQEFQKEEVWVSRLLDFEPIGLDGLRALADEVYGDIKDGEKILNPSGRDLTVPAFMYEEESEPQFVEDKEYTEEEIQELLDNEDGMSLF